MVILPDASDIAVGWQIHSRYMEMAERGGKGKQIKAIYLWLLVQSFKLDSIGQ